MRPVPAQRVRPLNTAPVRPERAFVLYWMTSYRRRSYNFALQHAATLARELGRPLVILEALRCGYRWASDRLHTFILQGMEANQAAFQDAPVLYHPWVEADPRDGRGLLAALGAYSCAVVTDDFPCFMVPRMAAAAAGQVDVALLAVDSNGLIPLAAPDKVFTRAYSLRRWIQRNIRDHLEHLPEADALAALDLPRLPALPAEVLSRWPAAPAALLQARPEALAALPIDHTVPPVAEARGGAPTALQTWRSFLDHKLPLYAEARNEPSRDVASGVSPWLHFGHLSVHQMFVELADREGWELDDLGTAVTGDREGFWGMSPPAEAFLDELVTWRELGFNLCARDPAYDRFESLPAWARATLDTHAVDRREHVYDLATLEAARTHDPLWNAAQRQLVQEGKIHNYLRMLWGKKIVEWSASPREALAVLIELNNKYALDGRDPNSYSGIFWVLGRYDRAWGPERPVYGTIRYMSSDNTARKVDVKPYLRRYGPTLRLPL